MRELEVSAQNWSGYESCSYPCFSGVLLSPSSVTSDRAGSCAGEPDASPALLTCHSCFRNTSSGTGRLFPLNKLVAEKKLSITSDRPLAGAAHEPGGQQHQEGVVDNLKVPWVLCPLEVPPRRQGQFLEPRALMSAGCLSTAARGAPVPSRRRRDPGRSRSVCC